ncbi:MAG: iron-sulfur cluster-binding domain-containing protein [Oscillospiraceae bacterium]|nr:iron-sulfur cluster-binding domain-containing protein [Oscillospiraceae bacterium]
MAVNVKVGLIGALDMLKFKNMSKVREAAIQAAPAKEITADYPINQKAKALHPDYQKLVVSKIINHTGAGAKTFVLESADGSPLAYFRAGQYLSLKLKLGDSVLSRPYSISSAPKDALAGRYELTVRANPGGFAADRLLEDAKVGDIFFASAPQGNFYYEELRDPKNILALAGGSGITPFLSMARAIVDGTEDFNLTILFGSRTEEQILFKGELAELTRNDKIHVIHVLSDEDKPGFEHGFLTAELVKKYAPEDYSLFICGPEAMYRFLDAELEKLALPRKNVRRELLGVTKNIAAHPDFPDSARGASYSITVRQGPRETVLTAAAEEPILVALERAGLTVPSRCRSGECGWCRSKVVKGEYFVPAENDGRRYADKMSGYIHPCASFPLSDMVLEVPGEYSGE